MRIDITWSNGQKETHSSNEDLEKEFQTSVKKRHNWFRLGSQELNLSNAQKVEFIKE